VTQASPLAATVDTQASLEVRAVVLPRVVWETGHTPQGEPTFLPRKGTWYGHVFRSKGPGAILSTIVPMLGCPNCGGLTILVHNPRVAEIIRVNGRPSPVVHQVSHLGKVAPDIRCKHGSCDFHRRVYLDQWLKNKPLFAVAYCQFEAGKRPNPNDPTAHGSIQIDYCHAIDRREALAQFGRRPNCQVIDAGRAVGFHFEEKTRKLTAD
jgi:hypothetical protein